MRREAYGGAGQGQAARLRVDSGGGLYWGQTSLPRLSGERCVRVTRLAPALPTGPRRTHFLCLILHCIVRPTQGEPNEMKFRGGLRDARA